MIRTNKKQKYQIGEIVKMTDGHLAVIEYSYSQSFYNFSKNSWNEYSVVYLNDKGKADYSVSWISLSRIKESVDKDYEKGLKIIRKYNGKVKDPMDVPMYMDRELHEYVGYKI